MDIYKYISSILTALFLITTGSAQLTSTGNIPEKQLFIASTPCNPGTKPLPGIPENAACEFMKWWLELSGEAGKQNSGTFKILCRYGMTKPGTTDFTGEKTVSVEGKWNITKGSATNPEAVVYRLTDQQTHKTISLIKLSDSLLHLLDDSEHLMIGNAGWSFTLNRAVNK